MLDSEMNKKLKPLFFVFLLLIGVMINVAFASDENEGKEFVFSKQPFAEGKAETADWFTYGDPIYGLVTLTKYDYRDYAPEGPTGSLWDLFGVEDERTVFNIRVVFYSLDTNFQAESRVSLKASDPLCRLLQLPVEITPDAGLPVQLGSRFYSDLRRDGLITRYDELFQGAPEMRMGVSIYVNTTLTLKLPDGISSTEERCLGKGRFNLASNQDGIATYQAWEKKFRADADKKRFMPQPGCKNPALEKQLAGILQTSGLIADDTWGKGKVLRVVILDKGWHLAWNPDAQAWWSVTMTAAAVKYPNCDVVVDQFIFGRTRINGPVDQIQQYSNIYEYYLRNYTMAEANVLKDTYETPDYVLVKN